MTFDKLDTATNKRLNEMAAKMLGRKWNQALAIWLDAKGKACGFSNWSPATDIADAWELVEKMRVLYGFHIDASGFDGAEWRVMIGWGDDPISVHAEAATAPRAITIAALLAWGEKA